MSIEDERALKEITTRVHPARLSLTMQKKILDEK
jgi:hypothetical protein